MGEEYIGGRNPVLEALRSGRAIHKIWVIEGIRHGAIRDILTLAKEQGVVVQYVPRKKLDQFMKGENHQGVVAALAAYEYVELEDLLARSDERLGAAFLVILDGFEDPHNLGAVIRTGEAAGIDGIVIPRRRSCGITHTVVKASAGAVAHVPVARVTNVAQTVETLKQRGIWTVGADASGGKMYTDVDFQVPLALVIGGEGKGLSRLVKEKVDMMVRLPMLGKVSSLNASVACAILTYEVLRQRNFKR